MKRREWTAQLRQPAATGGSRAGTPPMAWLCGVLLAAQALAAAPAHAAGIEDTVGGTESLGRAANYARVRDFMAVLQNPANLALAPASVLGAELRLPWLRACFDRARDATVEYRQDENGNLLEHFEQVCRQGGLLPTGNLGWAGSFGNWGAGVGLFTPAAVGSATYGDDTIVTFQPAADEPYTPTLTGVESPNRQLGLERSGLTAYLMAGLGAQPIPELRIGISGGLGILAVSNKLVVSSVGGTFNDHEIISELSARDLAVPRFNASVVFAPIPSLEIFGLAQYHADARAKGSMELTANGIQNVPAVPCVAPQMATSRCTVDDIVVTVPFPSLEATFGMRYAALRNGVERSVDPLKDELWDLELDVAWAKTSDVDALSVQIHDVSPDDLENFPRIRLSNGSAAGDLFIRNETSVPKKWRDTWTLRGGGDVNLIPGVFAMRAGLSFATRAVPVEYMNIDFWPVRKVGLHAGFTAGLGDYRIAVGYSHLFYQSVIVPVGGGEVREIASSNRNEATAVNEGRYDATQDIFSVQLNAMF